MNNERISIVKLWCKKAEGDFKTMENNLKTKNPPTDAICFHAQQAIDVISDKIIGYEDKRTEDEKTI